MPRPRRSPCSFPPPAASIAVALSLLGGGGAAAQEPPPAVPSKGEPVAETPPEPRAALSLPSPAEYYLALARATNPRWRKWYREIAPQPPTQRAKVAAGLGMILADAHIAGMARDGQGLRNLCSEAVSFAKILGLSEDAGPRVAAIEAAAERGEWSAAHLELETLVVTFDAKLKEQRDDDLGRLLQLGLWVRVLHVGSGVVASGDVEDFAMASGGATVPAWMGETVGRLSEGCRADGDIAYLVRQAEKLSRVWSLEKLRDGREWTIEEAKDTHDRLDGIIKHLTRR